MPRYNFDQQFFKYFQQLDRKLLARSLNLGGSPYGGGGPPGGFIGYLPQDRVSYDTIELESNATPASGISLVDNLNHIRYRLGAIEGTVVGSGGGVNIYEDDVLVASDVTLINFEGGVTVIDEGSNKVTIDITGNATDEKVKISANDTTANYLFPKLAEGTGITITELNNGGDETIEIASTVVNTDEKTKVSANDTLAGYLLSKLTPGTGIDITELNNGGNEQVEITCTASGVFTGISVEEDNALIASDVTVLNFEGSVSVVDDTGGHVTVTVTASGVGGDMDMIAIQVFC
jgi:hypothetical protein